MTKTTITRVSTENAPGAAGGYSQGVVVGDLVFTAGFGPADPVTGAIPEGIAAQTRQALANVQAVLKAAGSDLNQTVKVTVHLSDLSNWAAFDAIYRESFEPGHLPARTTVGSVLKGILVEIDVVALVAN
ncbi:MAG: hypothetical protein JWM49_852 [Microbacteriaceae bacterium]|nr:hypothetical protein [Microbacteriaceae bacterium]